MREYKKLKRAYIYSLIILVLVIIICVLISKSLENKNIIIGGVIISLIIYVPVEVYFEVRLKKVKKIDDEMKLEQKKEEFILNLQNNKEYNDMYEAMYQILTSKIEEINKLLTTYNLKVDFDYDKEEKYGEVCIEDIIYNKNKFFYLSIYFSNSIFYLLLPTREEENLVTDMKLPELIELICEDTKLFFNN